MVEMNGLRSASRSASRRHEEKASNEVEVRKHGDDSNESDSKIIAQEIGPVQDDGPTRCDTRVGGGEFSRWD